MNLRPAAVAILPIHRLIIVKHLIFIFQLAITIIAPLAIATFARAFVIVINNF